MRKIYPGDLEIGMYVSALDRPWLDSPFLLQGFYIEDNEDIVKIKNFCEHIFVDDTVARLSLQHRTGADQPGTRKSNALFPRSTLKTYRDSHSWKQEYPRAKHAVQKLSSSLEDLVFKNQQGMALELDKIKQAVAPMIASVTRNPDACIWLARMKKQDNYLYEHSLGTAIWAVTLGRQLGLPKEDLTTLAVGGLLLDVGKLELDSELLQLKRRLNPEEFETIKTHVGHSLNALDNDSGNDNQPLINMIAHHHERHNGSGYPQGLVGDDIPVFARIAAIVDCYDAITSQRCYAKAISPSMAIKKLYEWKDSDFQAELVEAFIQAIGIYPAGSLIELSSGEVVIVIAENRSRRLRPLVMVILDSNKKPIDEVRFIDLLKVTHCEDGQPLDIIDCLEPDSYGIDMTAIEL